MSIVEKLTEGIVNRDLAQEGAALISKWENTGLLEGVSDDTARNGLARLLENQAKELLRESSSMGAGQDVQGFAAVAFPLVRRVFGSLIANDLVSVQPMSLPSGLISSSTSLFLVKLGRTRPRNSAWVIQSLHHSMVVDGLVQRSPVVFCSREQMPSVVRMRLTTVTRLRRVPRPLPCQLLLLVLLVPAAASTSFVSSMLIWLRVLMLSMLQVFH